MADYMKWLGIGLSIVLILTSVILYWLGIDLWITLVILLGAIAVFSAMTLYNIFAKKKEEQDIAVANQPHFNLNEIKREAFVHMFHEIGVPYYTDGFGDFYTRAETIYIGVEPVRRESDASQAHIFGWHFRDRDIDKYYMFRMNALDFNSKCWEHIDKRLDLDEEGRKKYKNFLKEGIIGRQDVIVTKETVSDLSGAQRTKIEERPVYTPQQQPKEEPQMR